MINLLLVDDEIHLADSLAETIDWREAGVGAVYKAYSGSEALQVMSTEQVDIVVTDIRMPGMSGLELIGRIREKWKRTKLVLLTGYADFDYARQALQRQASAYLIKPVADAEIVETVRGIARQLDEEWQAVVSMERAAYMMRENLPLIRHSLLDELLQGRQPAKDELAEKLAAYGIPIAVGARCALMAIRLEDGFPADDANSQSLYEFAVGNIAEEIFGGEFLLWGCKDPHDLLVFLVAEREAGETGWPQRQFAELAVQVQHQVKAYLKGGVSIVAGRSGIFPDDAAALYRSTLEAVRRAVGAESSMFFTVGDGRDVEIRSIRALYEHPTLPYLLEVGNWPLVDRRIAAIFGELEDGLSASQEHLIEVYSYLLHAFSFIAHRNGKELAALAEEHYEKIFGGAPLRSAQALRDWAEAILARIRGDMDTEMRDSRQALVLKAQQYISEHLHTDVTLPAIADHVHLHPVYLSRIFKAVVNGNISDYIHQLRMERAAYLLRNTDKKVYEITAEVGYENPQYFSKVFRKNYGQTPLEYRDSQASFQQDQGR